MAGSFLQNGQIGHDKGSCPAGSLGWSPLAASRSCRFAATIVTSVRSRPKRTQSPATARQEPDCKGALVANDTGQSQRYVVSANRGEERRGYWGFCGHAKRHDFQNSRPRSSSRITNPKHSKSKLHITCHVPNALMRVCSKLGNRTTLDYNCSSVLRKAVVAPTGGSLPSK